MEWVDRVGVAMWVVIVAVAVIVIAVVGTRLVRLARSARDGASPDASPTLGPSGSRSRSARGSSLRPETGDAVYLLDARTSHRDPSIDAESTREHGGPTPDGASTPERSDPTSHRGHSTPDHPWSSSAASHVRLTETPHRDDDDRP